MQAQAYTLLTATGAVVGNFAGGTSVPPNYDSQVNQGPPGTFRIFKNNVMDIAMAWSPSGDPYAYDFDSGVTLLGAQAGWPSGYGSPDTNTPYLQWQGDVTAGGTGEEDTTVDPFKALDDGLWSGSTTIDLTGAWWTSRQHSADQTDFSILLTVSWNGTTITRTVNVTQSDPWFPTGYVGTLTVNDDGTFSYSNSGPSSSGMVSWTGAASDGDWNNSANWSGSSVPGSTDVVNIPAGSFVNIGTGSATVALLLDYGDLSIGSGASLSVSGAATVVGSVSIDSGGSFTAGGNVAVPGGTVTMGGGSLTAPAIDVAGGVLQGDGDIYGDLSNEGSISLDGALNVHGNVVNEGGISVDPGTALTATGSFSIQYGGSVTIGVAGTSSGTFGQITANGVPALSGPINVWFDPSYTPSVWDSVEVLHDTGSSAIGGVFDDLPEAAVVPVSGLTTSDVFTISYLGGANGNSVVVTDAEPTQISITSSAEPATYGSSITFTATVATVSSGYGTPIGTIDFVIDGAVVGSASPNSSGVATFTLPGSSFLDLGSHAVNAVYEGTPQYLGSVSDTYTQDVIAGPATHFTTTSTASAITGNPVDITVTAYDAYNNVATGYVGTVHFTSTDSATGAAVPADYTFTPGDNGVHTFSGGVTFATAGNQLVTATDTSNSAVLGASVIGVRGLTVGGDHVTPTSTGFTATLSKPFVTSDLNLYDASTAGYGAADVVLLKGQTISTVSESGTTVTVTTSVAHTLTAANIGQTVTITSVGTGYNGTFTITGVPSTTTFTYTAATSGLSSASGGIYYTSSTLETVKGSLILDAASGKLTFLKTETRTTTFLLNGIPQGSLLSAGTYQVTMASGTNGFKDAAGETLDGNDDGTNGDNFVDTFVVSTPPAGQVTVSLPDFARGPTGTVTAAITGTGATESGTTVTITTVVPHDFKVGNTITIAGVGTGYDGTWTITSIPSATTFTYTATTSGLANSGGGSATSDQIANVPNVGLYGVPIGLSNGSGVLSGSMTLQYNADLLNISGVTPNATLVTNNGLSMSVSFSGSGANSTVTVNFTTTSALPSGALRLGGFIATVPQTAPYKSENLLHWTSVSLNNASGAIPTVGSDALHVVAYFGDVDASAAPNTAYTYTGNDVTLATRVGTGADSGFAAYRLIDPVIIGDVTSDGKVNTNDASTLNSELGGPQQTIPLVPPLTSLTDDPT
jgi:hypothetical protein